MTAEVTVNSTRFLPEWDPPDDAPAALVKRWKAWLAELEVHEQGHVDIGIQTAQRLREEILSLRPTSECESLRKEVGALGKEHVARGKEADARYDEVTNHGEKQSLWVASEAFSKD